MADHNTSNMPWLYPYLCNSYVRAVSAAPIADDPGTTIVAYHSINNGNNEEIPLLFTNVRASRFMPTYVPIPLTSLAAILDHLVYNEWRPILEEAIGPKWAELNDIITKYNDALIPPPNKIFNCFNNVHPRAVKYVIVGQSPYLHKDVANGLACVCHASNAVVGKCASILARWFKEAGTLKVDDSCHFLVDGHILLLNICMTAYITHLDHITLWQHITPAIVQGIKSTNPECKIICFGKIARDLISTEYDCLHPAAVIYGKAYESQTVETLKKTA